MSIPLKPLASLVAVVLAVSACAPAQNSETRQNPAPAATGSEPPGAKPGACYGKDVTPAVVQVITEQILVAPAKFSDDGTLIQPAIYKTETHQEIVQKRGDIFYEVPCADVLTPEFIASLQRALKARRLYRGPITGIIDARTQRAIRQYQAGIGVNTEILTMDMARKLGLIAYERSEGAT